MTVCGFVFFAVFALAVVPVPGNAQLITAAEMWDSLNKEIRDGAIERFEALERMKNLRPMLDEYFKNRNGVEYPKEKWVFPVEGYSLKAVENYFILRGFDFFDSVKTTRKGAKSTHPAYDIFIRDRNHDLLDDRTGKRVRALSMSSGIVVGKNTGWTSKSPLRGGNYVWVYDTVTKGLFYYAHLEDVFVDLGDIVRPGDALGTIGRTGKNAAKKRSPTHLHIMYVHYPPNGYPVPKKIYKDLMNASNSKR